MIDRWPATPLGDVVRHRKEFIQIDDIESYKRCRVQLHAKGIVVRDTVSGAEIKTKKQQVCRAGEFLVAEIDAKVGGFGIVPEALEDAIVSSHYFLFVIDVARLDRRFLDFFTKTPAFRGQVASQGSTNYAAIRPGDVLQYKIPLPPLTEQRRIVARIEELAEKVEEARGLRQKTIEESLALIASAQRLLIGPCPSTSWIPLRQLVEQIENGKSPQCEARPSENDEWGVLKVGAVSFGVFDEHENKALPLGLDFDMRHEVRSGDFLMSRANTSELVGACAIVGRTRNRLLLSDKIFRFHFYNGSKVIPRWLDHTIKSPALREQIVRGASGTSPTMKNISKEKVMELLLPPHSPKEQLRVVSYLDGLQARVDALKRLQAETSAELDALLPSILDKAFAGEL